MPREMKTCPHTHTHKKIVHEYHSTFIHNSQEVETTQLSITDEWINKRGVAQQWNIIQQ